MQKAAGRGRGVRVVRCMAASDAAQLKGAREDIKELLKTTYCHPILVHNNTASSLLSSLEAIFYTILRLPIVPDNHRKSEPVYLDTVSGDVAFVSIRLSCTPACGVQCGYCTSRLM